MTNKQIVLKIGNCAKRLGTSVTLIGGTKKEIAALAPAIVGFVYAPKPAVVYDVNLLIERLGKYLKCSHEEAIEWYSVNTERSLAYIPTENNPPIMMATLEDI
jgi:hypothetical protein